MSVFNEHLTNVLGIFKHGFVRTVGLETHRCAGQSDWRRLSKSKCCLFPLHWEALPWLCGGKRDVGSAPRRKDRGEWKTKQKNMWLLNTTGQETASWELGNISHPNERIMPSYCNCNFLCNKNTRKMGTVDSNDLSVSCCSSANK